MKPDPEVRSQRARRTFTVAQREAILAESMHAKMAPIAPR